ncbi:hypothetical protein [Sedimentitalea todarodis]|uniref:DUF1192 domain-containing protein n=1 Tax=Sedimentitalea todarodis TaxID=1631240 RepID=A0ABU3V9F5_9RHOB|nr:hypothetical protein [Sedimentitalea todarodis]MDU9002665.1 hypothetical protein [Sedimentitalea todarodis]
MNMTENTGGLVQPIKRPAREIDTLRDTLDDALRRIAALEVEVARLRGELPQIPTENFE